MARVSRADCQSSNVRFYSERPSPCRIRERPISTRNFSRSLERHPSSLCYVTYSAVDSGRECRDYDCDRDNRSPGASSFTVTYVYTCASVVFPARDYSSPSSNLSGDKRVTASRACQTAIQVRAADRVRSPLRVAFCTPCVYVFALGSVFAYNLKVVVNVESLCDPHGFFLGPRSSDVSADPLEITRYRRRRRVKASRVSE